MPKRQYLSSGGASEDDSKNKNNLQSRSISRDGAVARQWSLDEPSPKQSKVKG